MGYNTANVRRLDSFAQAKKWFTDTPPIRGNKHKIRPLGSRRHHYMASMAMPDDNTVDLQFFSKTFVRWHADDTFEVMCPTYYSAYTPDNCTPFLPGYIRVKWIDGRMFLKHDNKSYLLQPGDVFKFAKVGEKYFFLNKPVAYAFRKRRGMLDKVMKKYEPFRDWLTIVTAITNEVSSEERQYITEEFEGNAGVATTKQIDAERDKRYKEEHSYAYTLSELSNRVHRAPYSNYRCTGFCTEHCALLDKWVTSDNAEDWVLAMKLITVRYGQFSYRDEMYRLKFDVADRVLSEVASHLHRNEVFDIVRLPDGQLPTRTNAKYFNSYKLPTLAELSTFGR